MFYHRLQDTTECFDCIPKPTPKTFPVCTIRSTPSQPIHCIVWSKSYLMGWGALPSSRRDFQWGQTTIWRRRRCNWRTRWSRKTRGKWCACLLISCHHWLHKDQLRRSLPCGKKLRLLTSYELHCAKTLMLRNELFRRFYLSVFDHNWTSRSLGFQHRHKKSTDNGWHVEVSLSTNSPWFWCHLRRHFPFTEQCQVCERQRKQFSKRQLEWIQSNYSSEGSTCADIER